jgi:UDP-N-acetylglucosamine 1-carboxyvinyltransferase
MAKFLINGGKKLKGEVKVAGSKNAVLPLMAASLLTSDECVLTNVPDIKDVETMSEILREMGAEVIRSGATLRIKAENIKSVDVNHELATKLRGSILVLGPLLARAHQVTMTFPGGDLIGKRPIEAHLAVFKEMGAKISSNGSVILSTDGLVGNRIIMEETSVTATENAMMAASLASGKTTIRLAAMEPHVQQVGEFLKLMGANISGFGTPTIVIDGVAKLHGAEISIIPDSEEAASLITLAAATKSEVKVTGLNPDYLEDYLLKLRKMNVNLRVGKDYVQVLPPQRDYVAAKIQCGLYPKLNSDYVPPMSVLATQAVGETFMYEWLYENRLGYVPELTKMGADALVLDPHRVKIVGPTILHSAKITSYDLRMGMTLVIAALVADGSSEIDGIEHIDRGYEKLESRLQALGADIKRIE